MKNFNEMTPDEIKEYTREFIENMTDEEWSEFLEETGFHFYNRPPLDCQGVPPDGRGKVSLG